MGLGELAQAVAHQRERDANRQNGGGNRGGGGDRAPLTYTPELRLRDGDTVTIRFNGGQDEPRLGLSHTFKHTVNGYEKFDNFICARPFMEPKPNQKADDLQGRYVHLMGDRPAPGCVCCHAKVAGDPRVGPYSTKAVANCIDCEVYHYVPNEKGTTDKDGLIYVNDRPCVADQGYCVHCNSMEVITWGEHKGVRVSETHYGGQKKFVMALGTATALWGQVLKIRKWCAVCWPENGAQGIGTVKTLGFTCPNEKCNADIPMAGYDFSKEVFHTCAACGETGVPIETAQCSRGCEGARRTGLWDGNWSVSRAGSSTNTTYTFGFLGVSELPDWAYEFTPADLDREQRPMSAAKMAERLDIPNPFDGQQMAASSSAGARMGNPPPGGQQPRMMRPNSPPAQQQVYNAGPRPGSVAGRRQAAAPPTADTGRRPLVVPYEDDALDDGGPSDNDIPF